MLYSIIFNSFDLYCKTIQNEYLHHMPGWFAADSITK